MEFSLRAYSSRTATKRTKKTTIAASCEGFSTNSKTLRELKRSKLHSLTAFPYYFSLFWSYSVLIFLITAILLFTFPPNVRGDYGGANGQIKIVQIPVEIDRAESTKQIDWPLPFSRTPLYCIGSQDVSNLRFICHDCPPEGPDDWEGRLKAATKPQNRLEFPAIQIISGMRLDKNMTGRSLICQGEYATENGQVSIVKSDPCRMNVQWMDRPRITNELGEGHVTTSEGNRFYIQNGGSISLQCLAEGNPPANRWKWTKDGQVLHRGKTYSVAGNLMVGQTIKCTAENGVQLPLQSQPVRLTKWVRPKLLQQNFDKIVSRSRINSRVKLTCVATGFPAPEIKWYVMNAARSLNDDSNGIRNASCSTSVKLLQTPGQGRRPIGGVPPDVYIMQSDCVLQIQNYSFNGEYWCSACSQISASGYYCIPPNDRLASPNVKLDVFGAPVRREYYSHADDRASDGESDEAAELFAHFCANPKPLPGNIYWKIDDQRLNLRNELDNIHADDLILNGTSCYSARLTFSPFTEDDLDRRIQLITSNNYGSETMDIPVRELLEDKIISQGGDPGLIVGVVLGSIVLLLLIGVPAYLCCRGTSYFDAPSTRRKSKMKKPMMTIVPDTIQQEQQQSEEPVSVGRRYIGRNTNNNYTNSSRQHNDDFVDNNGHYNNKNTHYRDDRDDNANILYDPEANSGYPEEKETLNFAQMDLVKERPTYSMPSPLHRPVKPPTNSMV